ncbi:MAG: heterocyst frequency control protein PatD [Leptolyngbyaceae cyanobacterium bins.59]|nr:heterocyst frequency control protein PatD [Leptolyngbyaceae cyanobacterium bins.59]
MMQKQRYETFRDHLRACQQILQESGDRDRVKEAIGSLHPFFQREILGSGEDPTHREQSYQVEISKQLRLLAVDLTFLQAARQAGTVQQRQQQMIDRLERLISYCEAVITT